MWTGMYQSPPLPIEKRVAADSGTGSWDSSASPSLDTASRASRRSEIPIVISSIGPPLLFSGKGTGIAVATVRKHLLDQARWMDAVAMANSLGVPTGESESLNRRGHTIATVRLAADHLVGAERHHEGDDPQDHRPAAQQIDPEDRPVVRLAAQGCNRPWQHVARGENRHDDGDKRADRPITLIGHVAVHVSSVWAVR